MYRGMFFDNLNNIIVFLLNIFVLFGQLVPSFPDLDDNDYDVNRCNNWDIKCLVWLDGLDVVFGILGCGGQLKGNKRYTSNVTWLIEGVYQKES